MSRIRSWFASTQAPERDEILNIGGFSDAVFNVVASYLGDDLKQSHAVFRSNDFTDWPAYKAPRSEANWRMES